MKANELRIGNLVIDEDGDTLPIIAINKDFIFHSTEGLFSTPNTLRGVPLTEGWLVKLGFKRWGKFDLWKTYQTTVCTIAGTTQSGFELSKIPRVEVEYVHQLQNLYFALTGEELKLTENENQQNK